MVVSNFVLVLKKQHVSHGGKMYFLSSPAVGKTFKAKGNVVGCLLPVLLTRIKNGSRTQFWEMTKNRFGSEGDSRYNITSKHMELSLHGGSLMVSLQKKRVKWSLGLEQGALKPRSLTREHTVDGRISAPPKKPPFFSVNSKKHSHGFKVVRTDFVHPQQSIIRIFTHPRRPSQPQSLSGELRSTKTRCG